MERQFTKADFYVILFVLTWWQEKERDPELEELYQSRRTYWNMGDPIQDRTRLTDLAKRILAIVRSYPPEESEEDSDIEAGSEGNCSESSEEENESVLGND